MPFIQQTEILVPTSDKYPVDGVYVECISTRCWLKYFCWLRVVCGIMLRTFGLEINNNSIRLSLCLTFDIETHFTLITVCHQIFFSSYIDVQYIGWRLFSRQLIALRILTKCVCVFYQTPPRLMVRLA